MILERDSRDKNVGISVSTGVRDIIGLGGNARVRDTNFDLGIRLHIKR
jgi:hypothetical protein